MEFVYERSAFRTDALKDLCERWHPALDEEIVTLDRAFGRVTTRDVRACVTLPVVRSSKRDGIAVRSAEFAGGVPDTSSWAIGRDFVRADTGDDFPDEYDAVIAIESVRIDETGSVRIADSVGEVCAGDGVSARGSTVEEGSLVVSAHTRLTPEMVAACAVGGMAQIAVARRPVVAFMATGSELVPWGSYPRRGQNIEANSLLAAGLLREWGAECVAYPVVADDRTALESALDRALACADIVVVNGGSSRGGEDFNSELIERRSTYFRHGVRAVPGRPVGMALVDGKPVVNMPGPVAAAWLCFDWLIRGLIAHYYGIPAAQRETVRARMGEALGKPAAFERIVRVVLERNEDGELACRQAPSSWGVPQAIAWPDGLLTLPAGSEGVAAGDVVAVELIRPREGISALRE